MAEPIHTCRSGLSVLAYIYVPAEVTRARRDPEGRKRLIIDAAADLIVECEITNVTHRKVAARADVPLGSTTQHFSSLEELLTHALDLLGERVEHDLRELGQVLAGASDRPRALARACRDYACDPVRVRSEAAFYIGGMQNPQLRPLATTWSNGLVSLLSDYTDTATARAVAVYTDGVMLHATLHQTPLPEDEIAEAITRLIKDPDA